MKITKILIYVVVLIGLLGLGAAGAYYYFFGELTHDTTFDAQLDQLSVSNYTDDIDRAEVVNLALFGVDPRNSKNGRSDAIMVVSLDYEHNAIKLASIARDTLVYISERDSYDKLNHAYSYGGPTMAVKTLNENFNLNITDYIAVNFGEMAQIVDLLGGVTVDMDEDEYNLMFKYTRDTDTLKVGKNVKLDGYQAVAYSRLRYIDSDDVRTSRQREVLHSLFTSARKINKTQYPALIRQCMSLCTTSLSYSEILSFSGILLQGDLELKQYAIPSDGEDVLEPWGNVRSSTGAWTYVYDLRDASDLLLRFIYEDIYTNSSYELPPATVDKSALTPEDLKKS